MHLRSCGILKNNNFLIVNGIIFFNKHKIHTKSGFVKKMNVKKNSYAESIMIRLYNLYFSSSIKLYSEYKKYYKQEFNSINDFLYNKYNLNKPEIEDLDLKHLYYKELASAPEYYLFIYLLEDDAIGKKFWSLVEV